MVKFIKNTGNETLLSLSAALPEPKIFATKQPRELIIEKSSPVTEDIFKKLCKERKKSIVSAARLTKGKLLAYLSRRYKGPVAKIIASFFDFSTNYDYDSFIEEME